MRRVICDVMRLCSMASQRPTGVEFPKLKVGNAWVDVDWEELLVPKGEAPLPPDRTIAWAPTIAPQRKARLNEFHKPAGRYNPRVRVSTLPDPDSPEAGVEAYEFIDRPWGPDELPHMLREAERILSRTGFVAHYDQHFLVQREGSWFVFADPGAPVDRDAVEERYEDVIFVDPSRFEYLPESIADAAGGPYGRLAWAMGVLKRSKTPARFERSGELEISPVGRIGEALKSGREDDAAAHVAWLLNEAWRAGWCDGAYFEAVRVSDAISREHREDSGKQGTSHRSVQKQLREAAMSAFIVAEDPGDEIPDLELARRAQMAHSNADPIFEGVDDLLDVNDPATPKETAKEIGRLRKSLRDQSAKRALQVSVAAHVTALLKTD